MAIMKFFDRLEDIVRAWLSKRPLLYGIIAGVSAILFFRGVWYLADDLNLGSLASLVISLGVLLVTGSFVSYFVSDQVILSGIKREKKAIDKTEAEVRAEMATLREIKDELKGIREDVRKIKGEQEDTYKGSPLL